MSQIQVMQRELDAALSRCRKAAAEVLHYRAEAQHAQTVALEVHRLTDDNEVLGQRLQQMEVDVR